MKGLKLITQHKKSIIEYIKTGNDHPLRLLKFPKNVFKKGGYLLDNSSYNIIQRKLSYSLRQVSSIINIESSCYDVLEDINLENVNNSLPLRKSIPTHELTALCKISQRMLDDSAFDFENSLISNKIAERYQIAEASAFIKGSGVDSPKGFMTYPKKPFIEVNDDELGYVLSCDSKGIQPESLIDLVYSLESKYRSNGTFIMNSYTARYVRSLKDMDGRFLWTDGLTAGESPRLLGYKVLILEDMESINSGTFPIAFGDFQNAYVIIQNPGIRILRDPFSAKPSVLIYATTNVGGDLVNSHAIRLLKIGRTN